MNRKRVIGVVIVCLMLLCGGWALGWFGGEDREVAALREQMENREDMTEAEREAFGERMRALSDDQRRALFEPMMQARQAEMQRRVMNLLSMPESQRRKELDKWIDDMEQRRRSWEDRRAAGNRGPGRFGGPPRGETSGARRAQRGKGRLDRSTPEMRAAMTQFFKMVNDRREERGLEPMGRYR
ncbi:hypothetical protein [Aeoliella sp.]|uniref:hypothetical protein n=1 Tax=Aeoliella sp. TaxID=2795800 RepID=UPI003CCB89F1